MSSGAAIALMAGLNLAQQVQSDRATRASANHAAAIAEAQAARERALAAQQAEDYSRRQGAALATTRARRAASGVSLAGSPLLADDAATQDALVGSARIRAGGEDNARRLEDQASMSRWQAALNARSSGLRYGQTLLRDTQGFWGKS